MTDLERAAEVVDAMGREVGADMVYWPETWRRKIQAAVATARREGAEETEARLRSSVLFEVGRRRGAEEMRERAAALGPKMYFEDYAVSDVSEAIRALPLTPEDPT